MVKKKWKHLARKLGFNLTDYDDAWDGVEIHLRIFGHLPEKGCHRYMCEGEKWGGYKKVEKFLEKLVEEAQKNK